MGKKEKAQETYGEKVEKELEQAQDAVDHGNEAAAKKLADQAMKDMLAHKPDDIVKDSDSN